MGEATHIGPAVDAWEADRVEWVPLAGVRRLIEKREIVNGTSMAALLYVLAGA
ncbi:hypothetical protein [Thermoactinospora rubra]|uniref:hypothetical protein n=1 Tax=Thermoactinospora rubra TaxID=1088767 RepID=UPI001301E88B|nr:hypothetical protein [Thermoactinospora rubra]